MAADMSAVVEKLEKDGSDIGPGYAQAYALLNCANAVGCMIGPIVAGALIDRYDWRTMNIVLTVLAASGLAPAVSLLLIEPGVNLTCIQILFTGGPLFKGMIAV